MVKLTVVGRLHLGERCVTSGVRVDWLVWPGHPRRLPLREARLARLRTCHVSTSCQSKTFDYATSLPCQPRV